MQCPNCRSENENDSRHCRFCGTPLQSYASPYGVSKVQEERRSVSIALPLVFFFLSAGIASIIFFISLIEYERIYFFDGYDYTAYSWIMVFSLFLAGLIILIVKLAVSRAKLSGGQVAAMVVSVTLLPLILVISSVINAEARNRYYYPGYYNRYYYYYNSDRYDSTNQIEKTLGIESISDL